MSKLIRISLGVDPNHSLTDFPVNIYTGSTSGDTTNWSFTETPVLTFPMVTSSPFEFYIDDELLQFGLRLESGGCNNQDILVDSPRVDCDMCGNFEEYNPPQPTSTPNPTQGPTQTPLPPPTATNQATPPPTGTPTSTPTPTITPSTSDDGLFEFFMSEPVLTESELCNQSFNLQVKNAEGSGNNWNMYTVKNMDGSNYYLPTDGVDYWVVIARADLSPSLYNQPVSSANYTPVSPGVYINKVRLRNYLTQGALGLGAYGWLGSSCPTPNPTANPTSTPNSTPEPTPNPTLGGTYYRIQSCNNALDFHAPKNIYCAGGILTPLSSTFIVGDVVQFIDSNAGCGTATYCGIVVNDNFVANPNSQTAYISRVAPVGGCEDELHCVQ